MSAVWQILPNIFCSRASLFSPSFIHTAKDTGLARETLVTYYIWFHRSDLSVCRSVCPSVIQEKNQDSVSLSRRVFLFRFAKFSTSSVPLFVAVILREPHQQQSQTDVPEFILWEPSLGFIPYPGIPDSRGSQDPILRFPAGIPDSRWSQTPVWDSLGFRISRDSKIPSQVK